MQTRVLFLLLLLAPALAHAQVTKLVKTTVSHDITADKKLLSEDIYVDFEKKQAATFVIDSVITIAGHKKITWEFFKVEMIMSKEDVQWKYIKDAPGDAVGLYQLRIRKSSGLQNRAVMNKNCDLTKGFIIYARENGKAISYTVDKMDSLPDIEQR